MAPMGSPRDTLRPASSIRQRVRYSIGPSPTNCRNRAAKPDRGRSRRSIASRRAAGRWRRWPPKSACHAPALVDGRRSCRRDAARSGSLPASDRPALAASDRRPSVKSRRRCCSASCRRSSVCEARLIAMEMAAKHRDPAAVVQFDQRALAGVEKVALPIVGRQGRIACDSKRRAVGQQEAVALLEKHRLTGPLEWPRRALSAAVRCPTMSSRARWRISAAWFSTERTGTKRWPGRPAASQIAAAASSRPSSVSTKTRSRDRPSEGAGTLTAASDAVVGDAPSDDFGGVIRSSISPTRI
jgi:hypothetical protein